MTFSLRSGTRADAAAIAELFVTVRREMTFLPPDEDGARHFFTAIAPDLYEFQVAEAGGAVVGMAAIKDGDDFLHHLYVHPDHQRKGIGAALLAWAIARRPGGIQLWCFQPNVEARRFYERHGFAVVEETDGAGNMERVPDVRYRRG